MPEDSEVISLPDSLSNTILKLRQFSIDRGWPPYHTPENLAKSIIIEAAELLEEYQWSDQPNDPDNVVEEIADVMIYCLMFCDKLGLDPIEIINAKITKNAVKYPIP